MYLPNATSAVTGPVPLLVSVHGGMSCAEYRRAYDNAAAQGAVVIWPQAAGVVMSEAGNLMTSSWNGDGMCCGPQAMDSYGEIDDVTYLKTVIDTTVALFPATSGALSINPRQIYMSGHSMGCMLSQRFLSVHSNYLAAMSCTAHTLGVNAVTAAASMQATPVIIVAGAADTDILLVGRSGTPASSTSPLGIPWGDGYPWDIVSAQANIGNWASMMGCTSIPSLPSPLPTSGVAEVQGVGCNAGVMVKLIVAIGCGHEVYAGQSVSTQGDIDAGVQTCTYDTLSMQYAFFSGKSTPADPPFGTGISMSSITSYPRPGGGDNTGISTGALVGAIIGGCFVPTLLCILWLSGALAKYGCKSPFHKGVTIRDAAVSKGVTMTHSQTATPPA